MYFLSVKEDLVLHRAPKKHAIPFYFEDKRYEYGGNLDHDILSEYLVEYKSQSRVFKENLTLPQFIQLKEERRPCNNRRIKYNRFVLYKFDAQQGIGEWIWMHSS